MKEALVAYALSITDLQRLLRIEDALQKGNAQILADEQANQPHNNWSPIERTDWLLLEIDANILIRPVQVDVALATVSPLSGTNSVCQLLMGAGKTSCIMPMVSATLADGNKLLLGREMRHIPWSRKTSTKSNTVEYFFNIVKYMQKAKGVILALPEHMLSFRLSGLQRLSDGLDATSMIKVQNWLDTRCRDIIDEVDFILAIRTQLIYPGGTQRTVEAHPNRWVVIENLLKMVNSHLWTLEKRFPHSIEVVRRAQGGFPVLYFLRADVQNALISSLVDDIYQGRSSFLPEGCCRADRDIIRRFISEPRVPQDVALQITQLYKDRPATRQIILLLRGLLVHRILIMALRKRANVQFGLSLSRSLLAVPFHAKGIASENSEFGHPDTSILLTCLAFYFDGLTLDQLRQSLESVLKSDDPSQVYDGFSRSSNLPESLKDWSAINLDDEAQLHEIWLHIRYQVSAIDYFLNHCVFPQNAKQFQMKLQASGWDLPLFSGALPKVVSSTNPPGSKYSTITTGFSGTADLHRLLPLNIKQENLPALAHTSTEVLSYLLQRRNREYVLAADYRGKRVSEKELLQMITNRKLRVFIDAGASILEMNNTDLAKAWLEIYPDASAIVYFRGEKPVVRYRRGHEVPLLASPYSQDLGECLVYLDEAHTRGTDLKIPAGARAALSLGLGQNKDHTVQAAMRMRQLKNSQSVVFFAPPEVHQSILDVRGKTSRGSIDSSDVIHWLLEQTCNGIEQLQPLYFSQGADFCTRTQAAIDNREFLTDVDQRENYLSVIKQFEQQTLEQLYGVKSTSRPAILPGTLSPEIAKFKKELDTRRRNFQDTGLAVHASALQEVEIQREVAYEVENVREVQKVTHYLPFSFPGVHRDILGFFKTGRLAADSVAYEPAFTALRRTSLGRKHGIKVEGTTGKLYVSTEFTKTVKFPSEKFSDTFQRPVNWVLWSSVYELAMIVIPEEAEHLLPLLHNVKSVPTHIILYSAPVTRGMLQKFNKLGYYSVPALPPDWEAPFWLRVELGIFAGRSYFEYDEYLCLCKYLGVKEKSGNLEEGKNDESIGSSEPDETSQSGSENVDSEVEANAPITFARKPLTFVHEWMAIRRKGLDFANTPMGYLCQGKILTPDHPFFAKPEVLAQEDGAQVRSGGVRKAADEEDDVEEEFYDDEHVYDVPDDEEDNIDDSQLLADLADVDVKSDDSYGTAHS
ncbi:hypothetical protein G7Y89_g13348 [Cudoniella acicularis]|uniref:ubiquitinyl hydrolase 1 n=1 Tax=Cudoniella acicularis TaxID=354080 RepID=A0A8H4VW52_9HELO|nr:hypothetical protein G7Y89_g13348 [Cudoniella acicularis]